MKILVIGGGGREAALVWKLAQSPRTIALWCAPGNALIAQERLLKNGNPIGCVPIGVNDAETLIAFGRENGVNLFVIGPEAPFFFGVSDKLRAAGFAVWGPSQAASLLEKSKKLFQEFVGTYGVPAPRGYWFTKVDPGVDFAKQFDYRVAVKASEPCEGKGVTMCLTEQEVRNALIANIFEERFNGAGKCSVIQERLYGEEASLHAIIATGEEDRLCPHARPNIVTLDSVKDHKCVEEGDHGLLGGGSGTVSPHPTLDKEALELISLQALTPLCKGCSDLGIDYSGPIFPGLMFTSNGPKMLECNVRLGDPETQVLLTRLKPDLVDIIERSLNGTLNGTHLNWDAGVAICVVMMAKGYPVSHKEQAGKRIEGLKEVLTWPNLKVFGAGIAMDASGEYIVNGGRVLGITALAPTLDSARVWAYTAAFYIAAASKSRWAHFRRDIGGPIMKF